MIRRALGVLALVALLAACSKGPGSATPTTLPPTTRVPAPITPTGVVDQVRNWVQVLAAGRDADAWAALGPQTQALVGSRENYPKVRSELERTYGRFAKVAATYDGLPVADGLAVVVVHNELANGSFAAAALPMVAVGGRSRRQPGRSPVVANVTSTGALSALLTFSVPGTL